MASVSRKQYLLVFTLLAALTALELGVTKLGLGRTTLIWLLVALAASKAAFVLLFYMHLKQETRGLRLSVAIPLALPGLYALVLIAEAGWRLLPS